MTSQVLLATRRRQLKFPARSDLQTHQPRQSRLARKSGADHSRNALTGTKNLVTWPVKLPNTLTSSRVSRGLSPTNQRKKNSLKEQHTRVSILLERLADIMCDEFEQGCSSPWERHGGRWQRWRGTVTRAAHRQQRKPSHAMPRLDYKKLPPLAFLFAPSVNEPLVVFYSNNRFAALDTEEENWNWSWHGPIWMCLKTLSWKTRIEAVLLRFASRTLRSRCLNSTKRVSVVHSTRWRKEEENSTSLQTKHLR